ncbi:MAG: transposase, partial [Candidatus Aenigmarchaeota archaeon]|nr:transposase [Candidatus Aenigmarchaeota archaeon]
MLCINSYLTYSSYTIQRLTPILEQTLGRKLVLPKRQIRTLDELTSLFPELFDIFVDGTERPMQRPKNKDKQKNNYSSKKKKHTRKNTIISDKNKRIVYLGPTAEGKKHDYSMFKDEIPSDIKSKHKSKKHNFWMDLGYMGVEKDYPNINIIMPKKKPKGKELTENEKKNNQIISGFRVKAEHAIGGIKRLRITTDVFRNKKDKFNDTV